jgi:hypothetical protein
MSERTKVTHAAETRDGIIEWLRRELVGPAPGHPVVQLNGEEILRPQDPPRFRYACGILFPNGVAYSGSEGAAAEEREAIEDAQAIDATEQAITPGVADPDTDRANEAEFDPTDAAPGGVSIVTQTRVPARKKNSLLAAKHWRRHRGIPRLHRTDGDAAEPAGPDQLGHPPEVRESRDGDVVPEFQRAA